MAECRDADTQVLKMTRARAKAMLMEPLGSTVALAALAFGWAVTVLANYECKLMQASSLH